MDEKDETIEKVAMALEKYAADSQTSALEDLAKVAMFEQDRKRKRAAAVAPSTTLAVSETARERLNRSLAACVGLGRS